MRIYWRKRYRRRLIKSEVKSMGLTHELLVKRESVSKGEVGGIPGGAVHCGEIGRNTSGEGGLLGFN